MSELTEKQQNGIEGAQQGEQIGTPVASASTGKRNLGVSKDLRTSAGIPISAPIKLKERTPLYPNGYEFPIVRLVKVEFVEKKEIKRNDIVTELPVIQFILKGDDDRQYTHIEFPVDESLSDDEFETKHTELQTRIKHIYDEVIGANKFVEGCTDSSNYKDFFRLFAEAFNKETVTILGKDANSPSKVVPLYYTRKVYFKVTYYQTRLQLPKYPNFIQRAVNDKGEAIACQLVINLKYDKLEPTLPAKAQNAEQYTGGANTTFGANDSDFSDFPDLGAGLP